MYQNPSVAVCVHEQVPKSTRQFNGFYALGRCGWNYDMACLKLMAHIRTDWWMTFLKTVDPEMGMQIVALRNCCLGLGNLAEIRQRFCKSEFALQIMSDFDIITVWSDGFYLIKFYWYCVPLNLNYSKVHFVGVLKILLWIPSDIFNTAVGIKVSGP